MSADFERAGTAYDPDASGHELVGRRTAEQEITHLRDEVAGNEAERNVLKGEAEQWKQRAANLEGKLDESRAELEKAQRQNAAMREALSEIAKVNDDGTPGATYEANIAKSALQPDACRDYIRREIADELAEHVFCEEGTETILDPKCGHCGACKALAHYREATKQP